jgi:hypothetical protein
MPQAYTIASGDNLTEILKAHSSALQSLSLAQKENVIQNFLASLSPKEMESLNLSGGPDKLVVGQTLDLQKFEELFRAKQVGGEDLITHARNLGASSPRVALPVEESSSSPLFPAQAVKVPEVVVVPEIETSTVPAPRVAPEEVEQVATSHDHSRSLVAAREGWTVEEVEAARALEGNVKEMLGTDLAGNLPRAWLDIREESAATLLALSSEELAPRPDREAIMLLRGFLGAHELNAANGYVPSENMTIEEFLRVSMMRKKLAEGHF